MVNLLALFILTVVTAPWTASQPVASNGNFKLLTERGASWDYQNDIIRGINLGGWFILEPYITPSLFQVFEVGSDQSQVPVDEYHYTQKLGKDLAYSRLSSHWNSWIVEKDIAQIAELGLNFVRIPIGYWAFQLLDNDPYVQGQIPFLDQALVWCKKYNLKAWIDLHGAPGSQNGFDNSGLRDYVDFQTGNNVQVALEVLSSIFEKYGNGNWSDTVIGIELLNEPFQLNLDELKTFYTQAYDNLRKTGSVTAVVIEDAFQQPGYWDDFLTVDNGDYWNVVIDHHHYEIFSAGQLETNFGQKIQTACTWGWDSKKEYHWNIAGEWSAALTDCALWLNGVGRGARFSGDYDNSPYIGSCAPYTDLQSWTPQHKSNVRQFIEAQLDAFEYTGGWVFWNWKTENAIDWDFQKLTNAGVFPSPLTSREYPNQCGFPS